MNQKALEGIVVLDLARVLAGPYCAAILGDMGADVIKIEVPGRGDDSRFFNAFANGESAYFMNLNRNKRGMTLNLKNQEAKELFIEMVKKADVVVENFRPGTMEKMGLGYDVLREHNPGIIYAAISGYGASGRYHKRPGYDITVQAMSGVMSITGHPGTRPVRCGAPIGDVMGGLSAALGILSALQYRSRTGRGQMIDVALLDTLVALQANISQLYLVGGQVPGQFGNRYASACPNEEYKAKDGMLVIAAANDALWEKLCVLMGRRDLFENKKYKTNFERVTHADEIKAEIEQWLSDKSVAEAFSLIDAAGIPASPIYDLRQVTEDPHIAIDRKMFVQTHHPKAGDVVLTGPHIKMSETDPEIRLPSPMLGEHTDEILSGWMGLDAKQIQQLRDKGAI